MGHRCHHCNKPLIRATLVRTAASGKKTHTEAAICLNSVPPYVFEITESTPTTHGMCPTCAALDPIERDAKLQSMRQRKAQSVISEIDATLQSIAGKGKNK